MKQGQTFVNRLPVVFDTPIIKQRPQLHSCTHQDRCAKVAVGFRSLGCAYLSTYEYGKDCDALLKSKLMTNLNQETLTK